MTPANNHDPQRLVSLFLQLTQILAPASKAFFLEEEITTDCFLRVQLRKRQESCLRELLLRTCG
jgi:hypothetical protein